MERELWPPLYRLVLAVARDVRQKYVQHQPWVLVAVMLWAALHDRPVSWACQRRHWSTTTLKPARLPSAATLSRRVDGVGVGLLWRALEQRVRATADPALVAFIDGKPLAVGGNSKDPDARFGHGAGGIAKGYKLHAVWSTRPVPEAWGVMAMNGCEKLAAGRLVTQLRHGGYLVGDGNYDASWVSDAAWAAGYQLVALGRAAKTRGVASTTRARTGPGRGNCWGRRSGGRCTGRGRRSSGRSATPGRSGAGWVCCRRGSGGWRGSGRGSGPSP